MLQEFNLEFVSSKFTHYLDFVKFISKLSRGIEESMVNESLPNGNLFVIATMDSWYIYILVYL